MRVDIEKKAEQMLEPDDQLLAQANMLLLEAGNNDREMLKAAGLDHQLQEAEDDRARIMVSGRLRQKYGATILSEAQVKELSVKYRLKLLHSKHYRGTVPPDLGAAIARFVKQLESANPQHQAGTNLFIMAPQEAFNVRSYKIATVPKDPVLLYKFTEPDGVFYAIIRKWGNDFTIIRRLYGYLMERPDRYARLSFSLMFLLVATLITTLAGPSTPMQYFGTVFGATVAAVAWRLAIRGYWNDSDARKTGRRQIFSDEGYNVDSVHAHYKLFL